MVRPSKPILSRELIFQASLDMMDRTGHFTLPQIAAKLGVSPSSIYHHVRSKAEIVEGIRGLLTTAMAPPSESDDWQGAITAWATSYRDAFAAHPAVIPALVAQTVSNPQTLAQYDAVALVLERAGLSADSVIMAVSMLDILCLGAALDLGAPSEIWDSAGRDSALTRAVNGSDPTIDRSGHAFEVQLRLVVTELAAQLDSESLG